MEDTEYTVIEIDGVLDLTDEEAAAIWRQKELENYRLKELEWLKTLPKRKKVEEKPYGYRPTAAQSTAGIIKAIRDGHLLYFYDEHLVYIEDKELVCDPESTRMEDASRIVAMCRIALLESDKREFRLLNDLNY